MVGIAESHVEEATLDWLSALGYGTASGIDQVLAFRRTQIRGIRNSL